MLQALGFSKLAQHTHATSVLPHCKSVKKCFPFIPVIDFRLETNLSDAIPVLAGRRNVSLTCTVWKISTQSTSYPTALWFTHSDEHIVTGDERNVVTENLTNSTTAIATVFFPNLKTSHAGLYTCQGQIFSPLINNTVTISSAPVLLTVRCKYNLIYLCFYGECVILAFAVPALSVSLLHPRGSVYEGTSLTMNCTATLPPSVDTDVNFTVQWTPNLPSDRLNVYNPSTHVKNHFNSKLIVNPLIMTDAGLYYCEVTANSSSEYVMASRSQSPRLNIVVSGRS